MTGYLPSTLQLLNRLKVLVLKGNSFKGSLPFGLRNMTAFTTFDGGRESELTSIRAVLEFEFEKAGMQEQSSLLLSCDTISTSITFLLLPLEQLLEDGTVNLWYFKAVNEEHAVSHKSES